MLPSQTVENYLKTIFLAQSAASAPADHLDGVVIRMPKAYPGYYGTYGRFEELRGYLDAFPNLFLVGRTVAGDGTLDLARRGLPDGHPVLGRGEQDHAPRLADAERRLDVLREEQALDRQDRWSVRRDQLVDQRVDGQ